MRAGEEEGKGLGVESCRGTKSGGRLGDGRLCHNEGCGPEWDSQFAISKFMLRRNACVMVNDHDLDSGPRRPFDEGAACV